jgi:ribose 5-phosphate isomerase B
MKVAIGNDHRGFALKTKLIGLLTGLGHEAIDVGCDNKGNVDYPDFAAAVCREVASGQADRGILVCGTGIGMAITANKFRGIRAATCQDEVTAEICRRHNDVNVLCLSGDMLGERPIDSMIDIWLKTEFEGGRHARRIGKIAEIEQNGCAT